jgi:hypothetical protein
MEDTISKTLGLQPLEQTGKVEVYVPQEDNIENDFKYTRENLYSVIEQGNKALEDMIDVARASEHPRAYEVVGTLMKTLVDANKDLLDLSKKKRDLQKEEQKETPQTVNNNLFVSTAELQKMIENARNG